MKSVDFVRLRTRLDLRILVLGIQYGSVHVRIDSTVVYLHS